jgi:uncharacterized protein
LGIPAIIRVSSAAAHAERSEGDLALKSLHRVVDLLAEPSGSVKVSLQAGASNGVATLAGDIGGDLPLSCRRCGRTYAWSLRTRLDLRLVQSEAQERALMQEVDALLVENDELMLRELVEDEILLALPMLPRCETCENAVNAAPEVAPPVVEPSVRENPFAALKQQLKK